MDKWLNFVYNIKIKGYTNFGSDIRKLYEIARIPKRKTYLPCAHCKYKIKKAS